MLEGLCQRGITCSQVLMHFESVARCKKKTKNSGYFPQYNRHFIEGDILFCAVVVGVLLRVNDG